MRVRDEPVRWALVADDLTGAADTAVEFCEAGFSTAVCLSAEAISRCEAEVCAVSTDSRELSAQQAVVKALEFSHALKSADRRLVFKKIDSLMRGNVAAETEALVRDWGFDRALLSPALPRLGRRCAKGVLRTQDGQDIALPVSDALDVPDAESDEDLAALVDEVFAGENRILVAGSSGLGAAWSKSLGQMHGRAANQSRPPVSGKAVLCLIGSVHPRTLAQMEQSLERGALLETELSCVVPGGAAQLVRVPVANVDRHWKDELRRAVGSNTFGALVLSGGSTAELVLDTLDADLIEIGGSSTAGAPWGTVRGGLAGGLIVVTKSGAFGENDELTRILAMLNRKETGNE